MKWNLLVFILIAILFFNTYQYAQESAAGFAAEEPVLITSAGQSADILMVKILANKSGLEYTLDKIAPPEKVDSVKSTLIVCGGSTKGLGAAKIDKEQEYARAEALIKRARENGVKIIAIHVGGKSRRGALSDYFNKLVAEHADHIIVVETGNEDGYFTKVAEDNGIEIDVTEKIAFITDILIRIYGKDN
jgi:hypothetical protein